MSNLSLEEQARFCLSQGQYSKAETLFLEAFEQNPEQANLLEGVARSMMGRKAWTEAKELYLLLIEQGEGNSAFERRQQLAECYFQLQEHDHWLAQIRSLIESNEVSQDRLVIYAQRLSMFGFQQEALRILNRALRLDDRQVGVHQAFAHVYLKLNERSKAIQSLSAVAALDPSHPSAIKQLSELLNQRVPTWHFPMMNDHPRNQAFEEAIIARLEEGDTVLDIGCGAGLLSLMAARAGAQKVIAVESEPEVAKAASEIFKKNGYDEQIHLVEGRSTSLQVGVDIPSKADLLISEIFDVSLLGEDALNTFRHAQQHLLNPNAKVIPAQAKVWCALVESDELRARFHVDDSCGFDLSTFNRLRDPRVLQLDLGRFDYTLLHEPIAVVDFDFENEISMLGQTLSMAPITQSGRADGFIFWYDLVLAPATEDREAIILSTAPNQENTHWLQGFAPCYDEQRQFTEGDLAQIICGYRRFLLWLQLV